MTVFKLLEVVIYIYKIKVLPVRIHSLYVDYTCLAAIAASSDLHKG